MMKQCQKIHLQKPQRNRNATANFVNLIRTSTVVISAVIRTFWSYVIIILITEVLKNGKETS